MRRLGKTHALAQDAAKFLLFGPRTETRGVGIPMACGCFALIQDKNILESCKTLSGLTDAFMDVMTNHKCPVRTDPLLGSHG